MERRGAIHLRRMPVACVVFVIGILGWMDVARLVRSSFLEIKNLEYVESARVLGAGTPRIMVRHILPQREWPAGTPEATMVTAETRIEDIILSHGTRGMDRIRGAVPEGYCTRAAKLILNIQGCVLIGTGFPVGGSFETDGPIGAIALYRVLERLGHEPIFGCAPPISKVLAGGYRTLEVPILSSAATEPVVKSALADIRPALIVSIERPGVSRDGRYYNMCGQDISDALAKFDLFFKLCGCPTIAVGDGGNEIGMGNVYAEVSQLNIIPSVTTCDELVIATVSNWGVYGIIAAMSRELRQDLFNVFDTVEIVRHLVDRGAVDGKTGYAECSEDGFPLAVGLTIIERLRALIAAP